VLGEGVVSGAIDATAMTQLQNKTVLICGASVAGPTLAYWLRRHGFTPTVVEAAPALRDGGYKVDLRGVAMQVIERMGLTDAIAARSTDMRGGQWLSAAGKPVATLGPDLIGFRTDGDDEVLRGDLARLMYDVTKREVEYLFGDTITGMAQGRDGVKVTFARSASRVFDLVVGADGLHSSVRAQVFGPEERFVRPLGMHACVFSVPNHLGLDHWELVCPTPGKVVNIYSTRDAAAKAQFIFPTPRELPDRRDIGAQQRLVAGTFADGAWEVPALLAAMPQSPDFYFDSASQIHLDRWSDGRVALVGDAAHSPSPLSGQGTSLALVGAYVLAGELKAAGGDHRVAFARYEEEMRPYVTVNQTLGEKNAKQMVAGSKAQIRLQTTMVRLLTRLPWKNMAMRSIMKPIAEAANAITLKDY
jgi:2-polyprenyl-6-methoxyphenol hydroxylase-like FAD-dependent oxidoreductase